MQTSDLEAAARSAQHVEKTALGLVYEARDDAEIRSARDVLRLAVGLRRMLEKLVTTARSAGREAPTARKEE